MAAALGSGSGGSNVTTPAFNTPSGRVTMASGTIVRWIKRPGDAVREGEPLVEVSTDKINYEVESPASGTVGRALGNDGDEFACGDVIGTIARAGETDTPAPVKVIPTSTAPDAVGADGTARIVEAPRISAAANAGSSFRGWMQSTGQTSTHAVSFVPTQGSQIIYAIAPITIIARKHMTSVLPTAALIAAVVLGGSVPAVAQVPPSEPIALAGGRVRIAGDVSASAAPEDTGFAAGISLAPVPVRVFIQAGQLGLTQWLEVAVQQRTRVQRQMAHRDLAVRKSLPVPE